MERRFGQAELRRTGPSLARRRSALERGLLPHRPERHSQRETMHASRTLGIVSSLVAAFANPADAATAQAAAGIAAPGASGIAAGERCPARTAALTVQGSTLCILID